MGELLKKIAEEFQTPFHNSVLIFSVILFIILLSPIVLRRFGIPSIIGYIIAGVLIGPHGFNMIEQNSFVVLFSTIGLLYIMFIAGLELDLAKFSKYKYKSLIFGFLTFIIPIALGYPLCRYVFDYSFNTSLLTASMFATHTLVAYPIVSKLGIAKNEAVAITVGGTILTDTAVLIILAVIRGSMTGGLDSELWLRLGISFVVFLLFVIFAVPAISRWFFRRLEDEKNSQYIYVLSVVFFCAFAAEIAGLEPIIGAFAAGLSLNALIPHTSLLMNRIEFVGNSLFIPFFLISVGMLVDVRVIFSGAGAIIIAIGLTAAALLGKWLAASASSLILKYNSVQRNLIFGLSSAHAAATLAIILVGYNLKIVDENILNGTILLILITCLVASMVTEKAARRIVILENDIDQAEHTYIDERMLVSISNPSTMERLIDMAIALKTPNSPIPIFSLSVIEDNSDAQAKLAGARKTLQKAVAHASACDSSLEAISTIDQNIPNGIKRVAKEIFATDIVIGRSDRTSFKEILFGKNIEQLINSTSQNIFVYNSVRPINTLKRVHLICAPNSEKEYGFHSWAEKVAHLTTVLSARCTIYTSSKTFQEIKRHLYDNKMDVRIEHFRFYDIDDFLVLSRYFDADDMIIMVLPRKGSVSYKSSHENIPVKLSRHFKDNGYLIIYPCTKEVEEFRHYAKEFDSSILDKGLHRVRKGASEISKLFKK